MHLPPRWVLAVSLGIAAAILGDSLLYAVLPTQWPNLGLEVGMVGILLSANRLVRLLSNTTAGWVVSRWGSRTPFLISIFVAAGTTLAYASGLGFAALLLARSIWGVCWSFLRLGGYLASLEAAAGGNVGYYLGFFNGVTRLGSFAAVLIGGLLTDLLGFQTTVLLFAGATVIGGLGVLRERPPQPEILLARDADGHLLVPAPVTGKIVAENGNNPAQVRGLNLWTTFAGTFFQSMTVSGLITATLGLWLLSLYGASIQFNFVTLGVATITGWLLSTRFLSDFLWGPISGHLSDRFGRRLLTPVYAATEAGALLIMSMTADLVWTVAAAIVLFLAATSFQVTLDATAGDLAPPAERARTMSWYATSTDLGAALGPLVGYLVGTGIGLDWMYRGAAGVILMVALAFVVTSIVNVGRERESQPLQNT